jgi:hypothetical protein
VARLRWKGKGVYSWETCCDFSHWQVCASCKQSGGCSLPTGSYQWYSPCCQDHEMSLFSCWVWNRMSSCRFLLECRPVVGPWSSQGNLPQCHLVHHRSHMSWGRPALGGGGEAVKWFVMQHEEGAQIFKTSTLKKVNETWLTCLRKQ